MLQNICQDKPYAEAYVKPQQMWKDWGEWCQQDGQIRNPFHLSSLQHNNLAPIHDKSAFMRALSSMWVTVKPYVTEIWEPSYWRQVHTQVVDSVSMILPTVGSTVCQLVTRALVWCESYLVTCWMTTIVQWGGTEPALDPQLGPQAWAYCLVTVWVPARGELSWTMAERGWNSGQSCFSFHSQNWSLQNWLWRHK